MCQQRRLSSPDSAPYWLTSKHFVNNKRLYSILTPTKKEKKQKPRLCQVAFEHYLTFDTVKGLAFPCRQRQFFAQALRPRQVLLMSDLGRQNQDLSCNCQGRPRGSYCTKYQGKQSALLCVNLSATALLERVQPPRDWSAGRFRKELMLSVQLSMFVLCNSRPRTLNHVYRNYHL